MAAHETERLWELARGRLTGAEAEAVRAHVADCAQCSEELKAAEAGARAFGTIAPPARPAAEWRAVDERVLSAARARMEAGPLRRFFESLRLQQVMIGAALVAAAVIAFFVLRSPPELGAGPSTPAPQVASSGASGTTNGTTVAKQTPVEQEPQPSVVPTTAPKIARVVSSSNASKLRGATSVSEGARVETERDGEAVLQLPEGSAIDVRANSAATLASLDEHDVRLTVDRGEVVVAATHREERTFEVVAGDATVRVVGTRFSVSRTLDGAIVRVTEGKVRVAAHGQEAFVGGGEQLTVTPKALQKRTLADDIQRELAPFIAKLEQVIQPMPKRPEPAVKSTATTPEVRTGQETTSSAQDASTPSTPENPSAVASATSEKAPPGSDDWELPAMNSTTGGRAPAPSPSVDAGPGFAVAPKTASSTPDAGTKNKAWINMNGAVDDMKKWLDVDWNAPFPPVGMTLVEYRVHQMEHLADDGRCKHVLTRADEWVAQFVTDAGKPPDAGLYRTVELTRARCLEKLGRVDEAKRVRANWP